MPSRIYTSSYPKAAVPTNESIWQHFVRSNIDDISPEKVILQEYERPERTITYGDAPRAAAVGATGLQDILGLKPQDTIMLIGSNTIDWVELAFAAFWAGIVVAQVLLYCP